MNLNGYQTMIDTMFKKGLVLTENDFEEGFLNFIREETSFVYLILNTGAVKLLSIDWNEGKAVILLSSQKTIPVAMTVLAFIPVAEETKGLIAIPCITFHFVQIIIDALLATRWGNCSTV